MERNDKELAAEAETRHQPSSASDAVTLPSSAFSASHPSRIGPFTIVRPLGQGGMGIVYEAEQERPRRQVALKVLRSGIVPAEILRRFELEGELLGRLHHPGIAHIYQAGVEETTHGRQPYFVMELVRGERLDEYVRSHRLTLRETLLLVAAIADAVQHAHHAGVIHRDLKPANILVTEEGQPKILDFGLARAAPDPLLGTVHTVAGEVLGTIAYMSPEQIAGDVDALDTRSDVYALGVILYELISGRPPYQVERVSLIEAARVIHNVEPTRLRAVDRKVPADVETIVAKALEKEKERRYSSAADLANDIRRFLEDRPIVARPPSAIYQVSKFARRHKALVAGVLVLFLVLIAGVAATLWQARLARERAREAELEKAKAQAVTTFLTEMLESVDPAQARGRDVSVREALDAATARVDSGAMAEQPAVEIAVRNVIGTTYGSLGSFEPAERQLRAAIDAGSRISEAPAERADSHARLVNVLYAAGKYEEAETIAQEALRLQREAFGTAHPRVASSLDDLGAVIMARGDAARAEVLMREALALRRTLVPGDDSGLSTSLNNLAYVIWRNGNPREAESMFRESLEIDRRRLGDEHPEVPTKLINVAVVVRDQGRPEEAQPLVEEAIAIQRKVLGDRHPTLANSLDVLAGTFEDRGNLARAEALLREALAIASAGEVALDAARIESNLGWVLWKAGAYAEAEPFLRAGVADVTAAYGMQHRNARLVRSHLAHDLNSLGRIEEAEPVARDALALFRQAPSDRSVVTALLALAHALVEQGRVDEALPLLREALAIFDGQAPSRFNWMKGEAQSALGGVLGVRGQTEEAERLLLAGYESLLADPSTPRHHLRLAVERVASFYAANGRSDQAKTWRARAPSL